MRLLLVRNSDTRGRKIEAKTSAAAGICPFRSNVLYDCSRASRGFVQILERVGACVGVLRRHERLDDV